MQSQLESFVCAYRDMMVRNSLALVAQSTSARFSKAMQAEQTLCSSKLKSGFVDGSKHLAQ
jgi:hypothetical protein